MNKDCRQIWAACFAKCKTVLHLCKPPPKKLRADTEIKDSRCSSTLTVICDRRGSELSAVGHQVVVEGHQAAKIQPAYLMHKSVARLKEEKPRASTLSLPAIVNQRMVVTNPDIEIRSSAHAYESDLRSRCNSVPLFLQNELETQVVSEQKKASTSTSSLSPLARELGTMKSTNSEDSDANSETNNFIPENEEIFSKL